MKKQVKVKPNSKNQSIEESTDGTLTVHLKSPPVDGKANKELIELLANKFNVPKSHLFRQEAPARTGGGHIEP